MIYFYFLFFFCYSGGIIRDAMGGFIRGFVQNLGPSDVLRGELLALLNGLKVARLMSIPKAIFETDSKAIISYVLRMSPINIQHKSLVEDITSLLRLPDWQVFLHHSFRYTNKCADFRAKAGFDAPPELQIVSSINLILGNFVLNDYNGVIPRDLLLD